MANYSKLTGSLSTKTPKATPQTVQTPGTVENNAGGFVYEISKWDRLDRFLILGTDGATYYCSEKKMTLDNAKNVVECIKEDGLRTVQRIVEISEAGRAPKNDPALFALALCAGHDSATPETRRAALAALPKVARIGTHLFQFAHFVDGFRGWGSGLRNAFANWYNLMKPERLALQVVKYPQRTAEEGNAKSSWSHDDLLRKCHARGDELHNMIYAYVTREGKLPDRVPEPLAILEGASKIKGQTNASVVASLIEKYELPHELVPKEVANDPKVWRALLPHMPVNATMRVLNRLTSYGVIQPLSSELTMVLDRLTDAEQIKKARIHPLAVLGALKTYSAGRGVRGSLTWTPIRKVSDALNEMLYLAFDSIEPTGKNFLLGLDVSGSMTGGSVGGLDFVTPREASAVMAMVTARSEKNWHVIGFTSGGYTYEKSGSGSRYGYGGGYGVMDIDISPKDKLDVVCNKIAALPMGGTDCALPIMYALEKGLKVDAFVTYTDNETWAGSIKPHEALTMYRKQRNPQAKMIAVGMTATEYSIADPNDAGSMNFVGFDTSAPALMSDFIRKDLRTR
jgi:60 kDa SS-A/Ro ribonucleoprotein